jgi:CRP/FNR family cyclic AMP-dependent transcriptional regulator
MKIPNIFEDETKAESFAAGEIIFSGGHQGEAMFVIQSGEVDLFVKGKVVETVGADGFFGEMALIEDGPRTATAVAKSDCVLVPINRQRFEFMVHEVPHFAVEVMRVLSRRLRRLDDVVA